MALEARKDVGGAETHERFLARRRDLLDVLPARRWRETDAAPAHPRWRPTAARQARRSRNTGAAALISPGRKRCAANRAVPPGSSSGTTLALPHLRENGRA